MKTLVAHEVSIDGQVSGGVFPFELGRQPCAGPVRISVGFEITEVRYRLGFVDLAKTGEGEVPPFAVPFLPVKRGAPSRCCGIVECCPAERKPEFRTRIT